MLYLCLGAARRNPFARDLTEAQFGVVAQKWLRGAVDRGGGRRVRYLKTHHDHQQDQELTDRALGLVDDHDASSDISHDDHLFAATFVPQHRTVPP